MKQLLFLLLTATALLATDRAKAEALNSEGFALYKKGKIEAAYDKFKAALRADETYAQAAFNRLCMVSCLYETHTCELNLYISELGREVERFVGKHPNWRQKVATDSDLTTVRETFGFQRAIGRNPKVDSDLVLILEAVAWYGPAPGAYGPMSKVNFSGGYVTVHSLDILSEPIGWKVGAPMPYEVRNGVILMYDKKGAVTKGHLSESGELTFEGDHHFYTDSPDECSA